MVDIRKFPKHNGRRPHNALTTVFVKNAKPGFYCDGEGLYLRVDKAGRRRWEQRLQIHGKPRTLGMGSYPLVSLSNVRKQAFTNRQMARSGGDPLAERRKTLKHIPTFSEAAVKALELHRPGWKSDKHAAQWINTLETYVFPRLGNHQINRITTADVLEVLQPIWHVKPETARRVRQRISTTMKWAVAHGYRDHNPAGEAIAKALPRQGDIVQHLPALPHAEVAAAIRTVHGSTAHPTSKLCFEFLVLTACRSGEVRHTTWNEIDMGARSWTIPGKRMKSKREHRVPLSDRAFEVLNEARQLCNGNGLVFPSPRGRPISDNTLSKLCRTLGLPGTPHGMRSSFRDWAQECTNTPREVQETALAHINPNKVEAAYARSDLFERRRVLMQQWADYLSTKGGKVVPMVRQA